MEVDNPIDELKFFLRLLHLLPPFKLYRHSALRIGKPAHPFQLFVQGADIADFQGRGDEKLALG